MTRTMGQRNRTTLAVLSGVVVGMVGLAYASVPLYQWFCSATGYGGTTRIAASAPGPVLDRVVEVRFNADVNSALAWRFEPTRRAIRVRLGEETLVFYGATNLGDDTLSGTATFNVTPAKAGAYFNKIDCFCFTEQTLAPGETVRMPLSFYIDPDMSADRNLRDVATITLSYTFFKTEPARPIKAAAVVSGDEIQTKTERLTW